MKNDNNSRVHNLRRLEPRWILNNNKYYEL